MTAWWTGSAVLFDLETDGKDPADARIIQWHMARVGPEGGSYGGLVKPERPIPDEAAAVHGITTERAEEQGEERVVAVAAMAARMASAAGDEKPVIGHNISYDLTVLDREMRRLMIGSLDIERNAFATLGQVVVRIDGRQVGGFWVIDTMILDKALDPYRKGPRGPNGEKLGRNRLSVTAEHYGVPIRGDAHTADADALAAGRIAWAIARRCNMGAIELAALYADRKRPSEVAINFQSIRNHDLPNLHAWQISQAAEQARSLAAWARANPTETDIDPDTVDGSWPLRAFSEETVG